MLHKPVFNFGQIQIDFELFKMFRDTVSFSLKAA